MKMKLKQIVKVIVIKKQKRKRYINPNLNVQEKKK